MHNKVKDTQRVFRKILDSLSRPGKIVPLGTDFEYFTTLLDETMDILMTLLDGEVTFHLVGEDPEATEEIQIRTLSQNVSLEKADYIIIPQGADGDAVSAVFQAANKGTLLDPNRNATLIIETEAITTEAAYTLTGPGVKGSQTVSITAAEKWLEARNEAVAEHPLGVDCFIIDRSGCCIGLPRTTVMEGVS